MATVARFRINLDGWQGGPGVNTFWATRTPNPITADDAVAFSNLIKSMYNDLKSYLAAGVSASQDPLVSLFDSSTGNLTGAYSIPTWTVTSSGTIGDSNLPRTTQMYIRFLTGEIVKNRFLKGGIYFGPMTETPIQSDGRFTPGVVPVVQNAFQGLTDIAGLTRLAVWHKPELLANDGVAAAVSSVDVALAPAILRRRRD